MTKLSFALKYHERSTSVSNGTGNSEENGFKNCHCVSFHCSHTRWFCSHTGRSDIRSSLKIIDTLNVPTRHDLQNVPFRMRNKSIIATFLVLYTSLCLTENGVQRILWQNNLLLSNLALIFRLFALLITVCFPTLLRPNLIR
jgi:hypothetical protein